MLIKILTALIVSAKNNINKSPLRQTPSFFLFLSVTYHLNIKNTDLNMGLSRNKSRRLLRHLIPSFRAAYSRLKES